MAAIEDSFYTYFQAIGLAISLVAVISLLTSGQALGVDPGVLQAFVVNNVRNLMSAIVGAAV